MISTITTSTISTLTTAAIAGSLALIGILVLLALLIQKELVTASTSDRIRRFDQALNIAIVPLLVVFFLTVLSKVAQVLK